jgi:hypothetical protein
MQSADRAQFDEEFGRLCAGYGAPVTAQRTKAYWSGLAKMSIAQFTRVIDFAIGEHGPEQLPPPKGIWKIHHQLRGATTAPHVHTSAPANDPDHLEYFANRLLWLHLSHRGGLGSSGRFVPAYGMADCKASPELTRCLAVKRKLVDEFLAYIREGDADATPAILMQYWLAELRAVSTVEPRTLQALQASMTEPEAQKSFDRSMARPLELKQAELA